MGEVWEARHRLLARSAAIKLVRPEVLGARNDAEARVMLRRFEREAQATASLSSPHTIDVFDFGVTDEGTFYYVMELLAGRDLETLVREFGPASAERTAFLLRQVCHSLADAHARGMVHRDIKPANIYVCRMGLEYDFVKVLDFGLVKLRERGGEAESLLTLDHTTTGTPAYMAPEIILGDADVDSRADVYALGCVAYYLLTGQLVFEADTPMKMLMQHVHAQPVPPSQRTELPIPRELDELVLACLEKDPNLRPQSAETLLRMCDKCRICKSWNQAMRAKLVADAPAGSHRSPVARTAEPSRHRARWRRCKVTHTMRADVETFPQSPRKSWLDRSLSLVTDVRAGEGVSALLLAANVFYLLAFYSVLKIVRDALILSEAGAVAASYAVGRAGAAAARCSFRRTARSRSRVNRVWLICGVTLFFASHLLIFYALGTAGVRIGTRVLPLDRRLQHGGGRAVLGVRQRPVQQRTRQASVPARRRRRLARRVCRLGPDGHRVRRRRAVPPDR